MREVGELAQNVFCDLRVAWVGGSGGDAKIVLECGNYHGHGEAYRRNGG